MIVADDVVRFRFGEKSTQRLTSTGFKNLTFKSYDSYVIFLYRTLVGLLLFISEIIYFLILLKRLGHYTIPEEMDEVCSWLTSKLELEGKL